MRTLRSEAALPSREFLARYEGAVRARNIRIGGSFAPEQFGATPGGEPVADTLALTALHRAVDEFSMIDLRLGLRWDHLCPADDTISSFYRPYLDYCFTHPLIRTVCLDIGPIKTFRWPEVHVPGHVLARLEDVPRDSAVITPDEPLAQLSYAHAERTAAYLRCEYGDAKPILFSLNESFHRFGPRGWMMSEAYLARLIELVRAGGYPDAGFAVSSSGGLELPRIADFFEALIRRDPSLRGRLTSGVNIYPFLPRTFDVPVLRDLVERVRTARPSWRRAALENRERAMHPEFGFRVEVTEAQAEPWGRQRVVGNSLPHYQHVLAESIERVLNPAQDESVIRMWGVEHQLQAITADPDGPNREIMQLTRAINQLSG